MRLDLSESKQKHRSGGPHAGVFVDRHHLASPHPCECPLRSKSAACRFSGEQSSGSPPSDARSDARPSHPLPAFLPVSFSRGSFHLSFEQSPRSLASISSSRSPPFAPFSPSPQPPEPSPGLALGIFGSSPLANETHQGLEVLLLRAPPGPAPARGSTTLSHGAMPNPRRALFPKMSSCG